jgi:hypothetical protein
VLPRLVSASRVLSVDIDERRDHGGVRDGGSGGHQRIRADLTQLLARGRECTDVDVVAVNDLADPATLALRGVPFSVSVGESSACSASTARERPLS